MMQIQHLQDDLNKLNGLRSGKCCLILESVSASTQDMGMKMHNIQWVVLNTTLKGKGLRVNY